MTFYVLLKVCNFDGSGHIWTMAAASTIIMDTSQEEVFRHSKMSDFSPLLHFPLSDNNDGSFLLSNNVNNLYMHLGVIAENWINEKLEQSTLHIYSKINHRRLGCGVSSSAVNHSSQNLTILTICWSVVGQFPLSPPGGPSSPALTYQWNIHPAQVSVQV